MKQNYKIYGTFPSWKEFKCNAQISVQRAQEDFKPSNMSDTVMKVNLINTTVL